MEKVELYLTSEKQLVIKSKDGTERFVSIFNGGGYYTDFMIQTVEEIEASRIARDEAEKKFNERLEERMSKKKNWYQFWK